MPGASPEPVPMSRSSTTMSKLMTPDEANVYGNVHGGLELQLYGDRLRAVNGFGDDFDRRYTGIASIGIGFSY